MGCWAERMAEKKYPKKMSKYEARWVDGHPPSALRLW
jgi:hypothetical protein